MRTLLTTILFFAPLAPAQTLLTLEVAPTGGVVLHEFFPNCVPFRSCPVPAAALPNPLNSPFGGVTWDGQRVILTDGIQLTTIDAACNVTMSCPIWGIGPLFDIAADSLTNALYCTDGTSLAAFPIGCPTGGILLRRAMVPAPLQAPVTAIDVDRASGNLWVCDAVGVVAEVAFTSQWSATVLRSFPARSTVGFPAPVPPMHGLVFDACAGRIYLEDASGALIHMDLAGNPQGWCSGPPRSTSSQLLGLARKPAQPQRIAGSCSPAGMPSCSPNVFTSGGDTVLGNANLRLEVTGAPFPNSGPSIAIVVIDFAPGTLPVPGLCAPLQMAGTPLLLAIGRGAVLSDIGSGTPPCHGAMWAPLPIPNAPQLCGLQLFTQWAFVDSQARIALSDALRLTID